MVLNGIITLLAAQVPLIQILDYLLLILLHIMRLAALMLPTNVLSRVLQGAAERVVVLGALG